MITNSYTQTQAIYQDNPEPGQTNARGWKTWHGYINEARQLTSCVIRNRADYRWLVGINFNIAYGDADHKKLWKHVSRNLRQSGIVALAVREPSKSNKIHYHIIVCENSKHETIDDIRTAFDAAFPQYYKTPKLYRLHAEQIVDIGKTALYITKGKPRSGYDKHKYKRLLFSKEFTLDKVAKIGDFWVTKKETLWDEVIKSGKRQTEHEAKLAEATTDDVRAEALQLSRMIPDMTPNEIERRLASSKLRDGDTT